MGGFFNALAGIGGLGNLFGGIYGGIRADQMGQWAQGMGTQALNQLNSGLGMGYDIWNNYAPQTGAHGMANLERLMSSIWGQDGQPGAIDRAQEGIDNNQNALLQYFMGNQNYTNPQIQQAGGGLSQALQLMLNPAQTAAQGFAGGGWSPQSQQAFDQLSQFLTLTSPGNRNQVAADVMEELLNNRGNTQMSAALQEKLMGALGGGGMTDVLNAGGDPIQSILGAMGGTAGQDQLRQFAQQLLGQGGLTETGAVGEGVALEGLLGGGETDITRALSQLGIQRASNNQVMSPMEAAGFAANDASQAAKQQYERLYNEAIKRGGGPGANVASGTQVGAMTDFADEIGAARSRALSDALLKQQGLNLQQQGMGADMALGAGGLEQGRLGTFSSLLGGLEDVASRRTGIGGGLMSDAEQLNNQRLLQTLGLLPAYQGAATSNLGTLGQLGLGGGQLAQGNLGLSSGFMNDLAQLNLGGMGQFGNLLGNQQQYNLGLGGLAGSLGSGVGNIANMLGQLGLGGGNLALGQSNLFSNIMNNNTQNNMGMFGQLSQNLNNGFNPLLNLSGAGMDLTRSALTSYPSLAGAFSGAFGGNPYGALANSQPVAPRR